MVARTGILRQVPRDLGLDRGGLAPREQFQVPAPLHRLFTAAPAEVEVDRRQHRAVAQGGDDLIRFRPRLPGTRAASRRPGEECTGAVAGGLEQWRESAVVEVVKDKRNGTRLA